MGRKSKLTLEEALAALRRTMAATGIAPTIEELRKVFDVSSSRTVLRYLDLLEERGDIERHSGARGIRILRALKCGLETIAVPIVGEAPAGPLMVAEDNIEGWIRLPKDFSKSAPEKLFLLRVRGNSMNKATVDGERIQNGDLVLVRQQPTAETGDIVVALIDGQATIKRFSKTSGYVLLKPESTERHEAIVARSDLAILGVVRLVLKVGSELLTLVE